MITLKTKIGSFKVCSSWEDLTVEQVERIRGNTGNHIEVLQILTTLTPEQMSLIDINSMMPYMDFINTPIIEAIESTDEIIVNDRIIKVSQDLGEYTYGQKIMCTQAMKDGDFIGSVAVYLEPVISCDKFNHEKIDNVKSELMGLNAVAVYSVFKFIKERLEVLIKRDKTLAQEPTYEQLKAGIKNFNVLGEFNTYDMLAQGDPLKYDAILALDYNTIFNKLLKNKISANFEQKYSEIIRAK